ncbi:MAG: DMT family transporter [Cypionkella sp.]|nr:DMT family transporter [Cypionkella sp.]
MGRWGMVAVLLAVGIGWGSTQSLGKIAATAGYPPLGMVFWQLLTCTAVLGAMTLVRGKGLPTTPRALEFYIVVAVLGTIVPGMTFYISVARLPAGIMSIIISTVPMMAFPIGLMLRREVFSWRRLAGLVVGLSGVLIIALPKASLPDPAMAAFLPLALIGPLFYALEGSYVARNGTAGMDAVQAMFGASLLGMVLIAPIMRAMGQGFLITQLGAPEAALIGSSALHALLYATFVWLAAHAGAVFATQTGYIVTVAGLVWASVLLGEPLSALVIVAACVMLVGVALVQPRREERIQERV